MSNQTPESWEDELSRQAEGVNLNAQGRPQPQAPTFQPGAASFSPGAASFQPGASAFVPGQQYQQYGGGYQYAQYGQQAYNYPQQAYGQHGAYAQQPGGFNQYYTQQPGGFNQQARQNAPVPAQQPPQAAAPSQSAPKPASNASAAPPKAKVLSIGATSSATAPKTKVLSIGTPTPATNTPSTTASKGDSKGTEAATAGAKVTAAKAIDKTDKKSEQKASGSGKASPTPSSGRSSPARAESTKQTIAKQQQADVDDATLKEIYGEKREHINVVFIGHVDAGKSTLGGSLLYCTGMVDERTMDKYKREAKEAGRETWYLSWALDLTNEERSKGKTVEVGRAFFKVQIPSADGPIERQFSILDAPGHKSYVPHMIGGASQADLGVLVISSRKGEYETGFERGGQTRGTCISSHPEVPNIC